MTNYPIFITLTQTTEGIMSRNFVEDLGDKFQTIDFCLETVLIAITPYRTGNGRLSLAGLLQSVHYDCREAGRIAYESLDLAKEAAKDLHKLLDQDALAPSSLVIRFWSAFEWISERLFSRTTDRTELPTLTYELTEARFKLFEVRKRLESLFREEKPALH